MEDKCHRHKQQCEKHEMVLGRAHQLPQIRPMDHLETITQENTTKETSQPVERSRGQILDFQYPFGWLAITKVSVLLLNTRPTIPLKLALQNHALSLSKRTPCILPWCILSNYSIHSIAYVNIPWSRCNTRLGCKYQFASVVVQ